MGRTGRNDGMFVPLYAARKTPCPSLASLSPRDKRAGYIEAIKVACIRDAAFFESIESNAQRLREFEPAAMEQLIHRCAELHVNHIATSGDPFEFGSARPLDFFITKPTRTPCSFFSPDR